MQMEPKDLLPEDTVQASRGRDQTAEPVEVAEGAIASVDGTVVTLGTRTFAADDGWLFDLIDRAFTLPDTLSEITVTLRDGTVRHLMGKTDTWMDDSGVRIPVTEILIVA